MFKKGTPADNSYLVTYDEVAFKTLTEDDVAEYTALWELACNEHKCRYLAVRVVPDALFGEGKPYIAIQKDFDPAPWHIQAVIVVTVAPDTEYPRVRDQIMSRLRMAYGATKTHYKIVQDDTDTIEEGYL